MSNPVCPISYSEKTHVLRSNISVASGLVGLGEYPSVAKAARDLVEDSLKRLLELNEELEPDKD